MGARLRLAGLLVAVVLLIAGCSGTSSGSRSPASPGSGAQSQAAAEVPAQLCGPPDTPGRVTTIRASDGVSLNAIEAGTGTRGVVLVHELNADECGWWSYASYLVQHGFRVLAFNHRCVDTSGCPPGIASDDLMADIAGAVSELRQEGTTKVALLGASQGGSEVIIAGTRPQPGVTGVAALSPALLADTLAASPYPPNSATAAKVLRLPTLIALAPGDDVISVSDARALYNSIPVTAKHFYVINSQGTHGWDLVQPAQGPDIPAMAGTLLTFLQQVTS